MYKILLLVKHDLYLLNINFRTIICNKSFHKTSNKQLAFKMQD